MRAARCERGMRRGPWVDVELSLRGGAWFGSVLRWAQVKFDHIWSKKDAGRDLSFGIRACTGSPVSRFRGSFPRANEDESRPLFWRILSGRRSGISDQRTGRPKWFVVSGW